MKYWRETLAVAQRILIELLRRRRSLIFWSIFPVSVLLGFILAERAKLSIDQAFNIAAPLTLVGTALFFSCLGGTVATIVSEREQHTLKRFFISPLSGTSLCFTQLENGTLIHIERKHLTLRTRTFAIGAQNNLLFQVDCDA